MRLKYDHAVFQPNFSAEAARTLAASRWTMALARLFGKKYKGYDRNMEVVLAEWKGHIYLIDCKPRKEPSPGGF